MRGAFRHDAFSRGEENDHAITLGLGTLLSISCLVVLIAIAALRGSAEMLVSVSIFSATVVVLYAASTFCHALRANRRTNIIVAPLFGLTVIFGGSVTSPTTSTPAWSCLRSRSSSGRRGAGSDPLRRLPRWSRRIQTGGDDGRTDSFLRGLAG